MGRDQENQLALEMPECDTLTDIAAWLSKVRFRPECVRGSLSLSGWPLPISTLKELISLLTHRSEPKRAVLQLGQLGLRPFPIRDHSGTFRLPFWLACSNDARKAIARDADEWGIVYGSLVPT
ncbi:hypothetical protein AVEN_125306-1 [Araneus ventricosus]|uniref:Uncharacterized protein n=1 Tax=Araneus ventricosus TaxID=182803 RepID=A0A4Y2Q6K6_ARAVE|nr:hypothetical protein AVEN_125306-1 [Araneus ventricosus]